MPKRSAQEKLKRYQEKIRKIEERGRRRRQLKTNEDDVNEEQTSDQPTPDPEALDEPGGLIAALDLTTEMAEQPTPLPNDNSMAAAAVVPEEASMDVDPEFLSALGACDSENPEYGEKIHECLSRIWTPLLKKGLEKAVKDNILKQYLVPENCKLLQAPKLNAEISAAISEVVRGRDKKLLSFQQQLGSGLAALSRSVDMLLVNKDSKRAIQYASDGGRLLTDLHHLFTKDRMKLIMPSLDKNVAQIMQDAERDDLLFGNTLSEKIKASKAIEKQGHQIKKPANKPTSQVITVNNRPYNQGNWPGPSRYQSIRGGRGAGRRPAHPHPQSRRPYTAPRPTNPPKAPRANQQ